MEGRAGTYVLQPGGYRAFLPRPLPPGPPLRMDAALSSLLSEADQAIGRLDGATDVLPNPDLFVFLYVRREAVLSSQIEGTQASLMDVLQFEAHALEPGRPKDVEEVVNYVAAMNHGLKRLKSLPISLRLIREIHGRLLQGVRGADRSPGEFRTSQNWIGPTGSTLANARFVPPPPAEMRDALGALEKFLHSDEPMPVLVRIGLAHAQFETIHPFLDGNGRVGRLLIAFLLCEKRILRRPLLYLSVYFKQNRTEYYDRLQAAREEGDWEKWIAFFLRGVREVAEEATAKAREIVRMREEHRERISKGLGRATATGLAVLEALFTRPVVTVEHVAEIAGVSFPNANRLVGRLEDLRLLREMTGRKRNRRFVYAPYMDLFEERVHPARLRSPRT